MSEITSPIMLDSTGQTIAGKLDNINASIGGNANIAPVFNTTTAYSKGDMVNYSGDLYVFTANHAAGAWTGSDAVQTKVSSELATLKSGLTSLETAQNYDIMAIPAITSDGRYYIFAFEHAVNTAFNRMPLLIQTTNQGGYTSLYALQYNSTSSEASITTAESAVTGAFADGTLTVTVDCGAGAWGKPLMYIRRDMYNAIK